MEDIREECSKYGEISNIIMFRSVPGVFNTAVGKVICFLL